MNLEQEQIDKLSRALTSSKVCIDSVVESNGMVTSAFLSSMNLPPEILEKKKREEEEMERILDEIDDCLQILSQP